jgi:MFS family permease
VAGRPRLRVEIGEGLGNLGYGLLWSGVAAGALAGSLLATRLSRQLGPGRVLIASAFIFGATTFGTGLTTSPLVAGALLGILGLAINLRNVIVVSLRQAIVPDRLVGRINATFQLFSMGMLPLGRPWVACWPVAWACPPRSSSPARSCW